jgi:hypothetical protein
MTAFGVGFGKDTRLLKARPCNTAASYGKQKFVNGMFMQDDDGDLFSDGRCAQAF